MASLGSIDIKTSISNSISIFHFARSITVFYLNLLLVMDLMMYIPIQYIKLGNDTHVSCFHNFSCDMFGAKFTRENCFHGDYLNAIFTLPHNPYAVFQVAKARNECI